jgi:hypothetical protein
LNALVREKQRAEQARGHESCALHAVEAGVAIKPRATMERREERADQ